ncbi:MAG: tRNA (guanosine(37)-N1)-methyltransferase TrmD [Christensenellales bacterium]|jgi:tRNA (guanine37-N1)-methyltransferase
MKISILTLFPEVFSGYFNTSIPGRAQASGLISIEIVNIRDYADNKHKRTDDAPFGGGAGMVMMAQPVFDCVESVKTRMPEGTKLQYMSPQGRKLDAKYAREMAQRESLIFLCGHYEGMDQRVIDQLVDEEVSIGDYVLTGGELAAMVCTDALIRFIPGVVGNTSVHEEETFESGLLEYPQYTRPSDFRGMHVPEVLLNGNHAHIAEWRRYASIKKTAKIRPDLLSRSVLTKKELKWLQKQDFCPDILKEEM